MQSFLHCGDQASGFTRLHCADRGHEKLVAFTCKTRHFCPSRYQRRSLSTGDWIAHHVGRDVPHRQFVFTIPRMLRGIFRKRRNFPAKPPDRAMRRSWRHYHGKMGAIA